MPKLVRDRIPEIILASGRPFNGGRMADEPYFYALLNKLCEEAEEARQAGHIFHNASEDPTELANELADLLEVIDAIAAFVPNLPIPQMKREKLANFGGFKERWLML